MEPCVKGITPEPGCFGMNALLVAMAFKEAMYFAAEHGDKLEEIRCHEVASALCYWIDHDEPLPVTAHAA